MYIRLIDSTLRENEYLFRLNDQQKVYKAFVSRFWLKLWQGISDYPKTKSHQCESPAISCHVLSFNDVLSRSNYHITCLRSVPAKPIGFLAISQLLLSRSLVQVQYRWYSNQVLLYRHYLQTYPGYNAAGNWENRWRKLRTVKDLKLILAEHHKLYFSSGKTLTSVETNFLCLFPEQCARAVVPIWFLDAWLLRDWKTVSSSIW